MGRGTGWAWEDVICHLSQRGHRAFAPTLVGHGPNAIRLGITHEDCVNSVAAYLQQRGLEDIILVGHSFGGTVVQKVAEQLPKRIARIVFLDALVLADNQCVFDALPADYVALFNGLAAASSDNTMLIPWEIWRDNFMQDGTRGPGTVDLGATLPTAESGQFRQIRSETVLLAHGS